VVLAGGKAVAIAHNRPLSLNDPTAHAELLAIRAAAAALGLELTLPGVVQTVILTRTAVRTSPMPAGEELASLAQSRATLAIHLSIANLAKVVRELTPIYGADCPVAVVHRASWPDQRILRGTLADIRADVKRAGMTRTAIILVGRALGTSSFAESRLYDPEHSHVFRPRKW
jgi:precorrin-4/cobalt-precorrin-4 C11-methyltransferase